MSKSRVPVRVGGGGAGGLGDEEPRVDPGMPGAVPLSAPGAPQEDWGWRKKGGPQCEIKAVSLMGLSEEETEKALREFRERNPVADVVLTSDQAPDLAEEAVLATLDAADEFVVTALSQCKPAEPPTASNKPARPSRPALDSFYTNHPRRPAKVQVVMCPPKIKP